MLRRTEGREKFVTGGVAPPLWYKYHGANRSYLVTNFSPVKQVNISDPWYYSEADLRHSMSAKPGYALTAVVTESLRAVATTPESGSEVLRMVSK